MENVSMLLLIASPIFDFCGCAGWVNGAADLQPRRVYEVPTDIHSLSDFIGKLQPGHPRTNTVSS